MGWQKYMRLVLPLIFSSSLAFGQWQPVPPADPVPTPFPGPAVLQSEINDERELAEVPLVLSISNLDCAAKKHAEDLFRTGRCTHTGSDGTSFDERARQCQSYARVEMIACGFNRPGNVMKRWMADPANKAMILNDDLMAMGSANVGNVWVVLFQ